MGTCGSVTSIAADIWEQWGIAIKAGAAGVISVKTGAPPQEVFGKLSEYEKTVKKMITFWNSQAKQSWARIGPRRLDFRTALKGTLRVSGGRVLITEAPLDADEVTVSVRKRGGRARTSVTVCTITRGGKCQKKWDFEFPKGDAKGVKKRVIKGVNNRLLSVHFDSKDVVRKFEYTLKVAKGKSLIGRRPR